MRLFVLILAALQVLAPPAFAQTAQRVTIQGSAGNLAEVNASGALEVDATITPSGVQPVSQSGTWTVQPGNTANTTPWLFTEAGDSFVNITTNTDTNVKGSAGTVKRVVVNTLGITSSVQIFNDADGTCNSNLIGSISTILQNSITLNVAATVGICAKTAGAGAADITVTYR